jgi:hypothetical protein
MGGGTGKQAARPAGNRCSGLVALSAPQFLRDGQSAEIRRRPRPPFAAVSVDANDGCVSDCHDCLHFDDRTF